jgi:hypothetical protein
MLLNKFIFFKLLWVTYFSWHLSLPCWPPTLLSLRPDASSCPLLARAFLFSAFKVSN